MLIPPISHLSGKNITHIDTDEFEEQSRTAKKHRSLSRHNNQHNRTVKIHS